MQTVYLYVFEFAHLTESLQNIQFYDKSKSDFVLGVVKGQKWFVLK